jgi:hypothetical protein
MRSVLREMKLHELMEVARRKDVEWRHHADLIRFAVGLGSELDLEEIYDAPMLGSYARVLLNRKIVAVYPIKRGE